MRMPAVIGMLGDTAWAHAGLGVSCFPSTPTGAGRSVMRARQSVAAAVTTAAAAAAAAAAVASQRACVRPW